MAILLLFLIGVVATLSLPAIVLARKNVKACAWDWLFPFSGIFIWLVLCFIDAGAAMSLANLIEPVWICLCSIVFVWIYFALLKFPFFRRFYIRYSLTALPILIAIVIRLCTPMLPE